MKVEEILAGAEATMSPAALRELAATLLRLADSVDQDWHPEKVKSAFPSATKAARIEKNALRLSFAATKEQMRSEWRQCELGADVAGLPAWNMLLELFKQFAGGAKVSTKSLQIISGAPETTALRLITKLEAQGIVTRSHCETDKRVTFVALTREGVVKVGSLLERLQD